MVKRNVCVIFGGNSEEQKISKLAAATIISNISEEKYNIIPLYIAPDGRWLLYDGAIDNFRNIQWEKYGTTAVLCPDRRSCLLRIVGDKVKSVPIDVIFPAGNNASFSGLFEATGISYVGSKLLAQAIAHDDEYARIIAKEYDIPVVKYSVYKKDQKVRNKFGLPCIVKPIGIEKAVLVDNRKSLSAVCDDAFAVSDRVIIESNYERELVCAILEKGTEDIKTSVVGEVVPCTQELRPSSVEITEEVTERVKELSLSIFKSLGCSGFALVSFVLGEDGVLFNRIYSAPNLSVNGAFLNLFNQSSLESSDIMESLIESAIKDTHPTDIEE